MHSPAGLWEKIFPTEQGCGRRNVQDHLPKSYFEALESSLKPEAKPYQPKLPF